MNLAGPPDTWAELQMFKNHPGVVLPEEKNPLTTKIMAKKVHGEMLPLSNTYPAFFLS